MRSLDAGNGEDLMSNSNNRSSSRRNSDRGTPEATTGAAPSSSRSFRKTSEKRATKMKKLNTQLPDQLEIVVKCVGKLDGKDLRLTIWSKSTVLALKKLISRELEANGDGPVPVEKQRLIFFGRLLKDDKQVLSGEGGLNMKTDGSTNFVHLSPLPDSVATSTSTSSSSSRRSPTSDTAHLTRRNNAVAMASSQNAAQEGPRLLSVTGLLRRNRRMEPYPTSNRESTGRRRPSPRRQLSSRREEEEDDASETSSTDSRPMMNRMRRLLGIVRDDTEEAVVPHDAPSNPELSAGAPSAYGLYAEAVAMSSQDQAAAAAAIGQHLAGAGFGSFATAPGVSPFSASLLLSAHLSPASLTAAAPNPGSHENQLLVATLVARLLPDAAVLNERLRDIILSAVIGGSREDAFDQQVAVVIDLLESVSQSSRSLADTLRNAMAGGGVSEATAAAASEALASFNAASASAHGILPPAHVIAASTLAGVDLSMAGWGLTPPPPQPYFATLTGPILGYPALLGLGNPSGAVGASVNPFLAGLSYDHPLLAAIPSLAPSVATLYGLGSGGSAGQFIYNYPHTLPPPASL